MWIYRYFFISTIRIRALSNFKNAKAPKNIWIFIYSIIPLQALEISHVHFSQCLIHHQLKKNIWETGKIEYTMNLFHFLSKKRIECPYICYTTNFCYNFCSLSSTLQIGRVYGSWFAFFWQPMSHLINLPDFLQKCYCIACHGTANNNQFWIAVWENEPYHKGLLSTNLI